MSKEELVPYSLEPRASIATLPNEVLRQIIQELVFNPSDPIHFRKHNLLPLASTCHILRAASLEFLFWSVDLFEASFGLQHRVLKSNVALHHFNDLLDAPTSYMRTGVRKWLVRDRDMTASAEFWSVLAKLENLRSLHMDGSFYHPEDKKKEEFPFPPAPESLEKPEVPQRLYQTLVNLTFLGCAYRSPLFPFFLRPNTFHNLTRIEYIDKYEYPWRVDPLEDPELFDRLTSAQCSPFAQVSQPLFPYLNIFLLTHYFQTPEHYSSLMRFIEIHKATLERVSVLSRPTHGYITPNAAMNAFAHAHELQKSCSQDLWKTVATLRNLRLLELDAGLTTPEYRPTSVIKLPNLQGVRLQSNTQWHAFTYAHLEASYVVAFFDKIIVPHVAVGPDVVTTLLTFTQFDRPRLPYGSGWMSADEVHHIKSCTQITHEKYSTDVVLEGGFRDIAPASDAQKAAIWGAVGGWSLKEDANLETPFVRERD